MTASRKDCEWHKAALKWGQQHDSFEAFDPRTNPGTWAKWRNYFRAMNWAPYWFLEVERLHDMDPTSHKSWTAPTRNPDDLKVSFKIVAGPRVVFPLEETKKFRDAMKASTLEQRRGHVARVMGNRKLPSGLPRGALANLFVGHDKPGYNDMVERSKTADPAEWCWYQNHPQWGSGIKVPLNWYRPDRVPWFKSLTPAKAQAFLDANEFK